MMMIDTRTQESRKHISMHVMGKEEKKKESTIDYIHDDHIYIEEQIRTSKVGVSGEIEHFL
jgi:hypothetical protein